MYNTSRKKAKTRRRSEPYILALLLFVLGGDRRDMHLHKRQNRSFIKCYDYLILFPWFLLLLCTSLCTLQKSLAIALALATSRTINPQLVSTCTKQNKKCSFSTVSLIFYHWLCQAYNELCPTSLTSKFQHS